MIHHTFICEHCHKEMNYSLIRFNSRLSCPHCHSKYLVSKSYLVYMVEMVTLFVVGYLLFGIFKTSDFIANEWLKMGLLVCILYVLFALMDIVLDKIFHYKKLFILMRKDS